MKRFSGIPVALILIATLVGCATTESYTASFSTIYEFDADVSPQDLWLWSNLWLAETYVSAESVIEFSDREGAVIVGNGRELVDAETSPEGEFSPPRRVIFTLRYRILIEAKRGRVRITFVDGLVAGNSGYGAAFGQRVDVFARMDSEIRDAAEAAMGRTAQSLQNYIHERLRESW